MNQFRKMNDGKRGIRAMDCVYEQETKKNRPQGLILNYKRLNNH